MIKSTINKSINYSHIPLSLKVRPHTTTVVENLATDDSGKHSHALGQVCIKSDCETKKCPLLCDTVQRVYTKGFFTHKPIAGKFTRFVNDIDADQKQDIQYYVKNSDKTKTITGHQAISYYYNNEIKPDTKMNNYIQQSDIANKIDE